MTLKTRLECALLCNVSYQTVVYWTRGYHPIHGKRKYYFADHHKIKAIEGTGRKNDPYRYDLNEVRDYQKACSQNQGRKPTQ